VHRRRACAGVMLEMFVIRTTKDVNYMAFTEEEIAYMRSQPLARVATVDADGQPDVVPVGFEFDGTHIIIGGFAPEKTRRHHNVLAGNGKVALVIDDLASVQPWSPRFLRVYGTAEVVRDPEKGEFLRVTPTRSWSFNLNGQPLGQDRSELRRTAH
jgi:pyridoxamine 5'-phosphate oxidase family protein